MPTPPRRRWFQFGLLLAGVMLAAITVYLGMRDWRLGAIVLATPIVVMLGAYSGIALGKMPRADDGGDSRSPRRFLIAVGVVATMVLAILILIRR